MKRSLKIKLGVIIFFLFLLFALFFITSIPDFKEIFAGISNMEFNMHTFARPQFISFLLVDFGIVCVFIRKKICWFITSFCFYFIAVLAYYLLIRRIVEGSVFLDLKSIINLVLIHIPIILLNTKDVALHFKCKNRLLNSSILVVVVTILVVVLFSTMDI